MRSPLLITVALLAAPSATSAQVLEWSLAKGAVYEQTADDTSPGAPLAWIANVGVDTSDVGDATSVVVSGGGIAGSLALTQDFEYWCLEEEFTSQAAMNAVFPSGSTYTITLSGGSLGTLTQTASFGVEQYPVAPYLTGSDWSDLQAFDATDPFTLDWNDPGASLWPAGFVFVDVFEVLTGVDPFTDELTSGTTSTTIPADTLNTGLQHEGYVTFANVVLNSGAGGFGAGGITGHFAGTMFEVDSLLGAWVLWRNAGANPDSYVADAPALGETWTGTVTITTGHTHATVLAMTGQTGFPMRGGQFVLVGGTKLFQTPLTPGPTASWSYPIPYDLSLIGLTVYTQGAQLFGVTPFALTNAQDLFLGV